MMNTQSLAFTWSLSVAAITRVRTLSRFSTPLLRPPKNSYVSPPCITATWSPPRPRAMSMACLAQRSLSATPPAPRPTPIDTVALMVFRVFRTSLTLSSTGKRFCFASSIWASSVMIRYLPLETRRINPAISFMAQLRRTASTSAVIRDSSPPASSRAISSLLSKEAMHTTGRLSLYSLFTALK